MTQVMRTPKVIHNDVFVILKRRSGVAMMGGCMRCGRKFFTPSELLQKAVRAEDYLRGKFGDHDCQLRRVQFLNSG